MTADVLQQWFREDHNLTSDFISLQRAAAGLGAQTSGFTKTLIRFSLIVLSFL